MKQTMKPNALISLVLLCLAISSAKAQKETFKLDNTKHKYALKLKSTYLGIGGVVLKDEYLSPLNYGGTSISFMSESNRFAYIPKFLSSKECNKIIRENKGLKLYPKLAGYTDLFKSDLEPKLLVQNLYSFDLARTYNPAQNGTMYLLAFRWDRGYMYRLTKGNYGRLHAGLGLKADFSLLYNLRNGNNPVNTDTSLALTAQLHYAYRLKWKACPMLIRLSSTTDLLGLRHAVGFGESYYHAYGEDFNLGEHLAFVSLHNEIVEQFRLSLDLPVFNSFTLSLSYRAGLNKFNYNDRQRNYVGHSFFIGLTRYILPLSEKESIQENPESLCF